jgi:hypothetical protein
MSKHEGFDAAINPHRSEECPWAIRACRGRLGEATEPVRSQPVHRE